MLRSAEGVRYQSPPTSEGIAEPQIDLTRLIDNVALVQATTDRGVLTLWRKLYPLVSEVGHVGTQVPGIVFYHSRQVRNVHPGNRRRRSDDGGESRKYHRAPIRVVSRHIQIVARR